MLLEDEHGQVNLIVPSQVYERHRAIVRGEPLLLVRGRFEHIGENRNILVSTLETLGALARRVAEHDVGRRAPARSPLRPPLTASAASCGGGMPAHARRAQATIAARRSACSPTTPREHPAERSPLVSDEVQSGSRGVLVAWWTSRNAGSRRGRRGDRRSASRPVRKPVAATITRSTSTAPAVAEDGAARPRSGSSAGTILTRAVLRRPRRSRRPRSAAHGGGRKSEFPGVAPGPASRRP